MPSVVVAGATGGLGREIVTALNQDKQTWPTVSTLSHSQILEDTAKKLEDVKPEYIFFTDPAKDTGEESTKVNGTTMLESVLEALKITSASKNVKCVILITDTPEQPTESTDRWLSDSDRPPNFRSKQESILAQHGKQQGWNWVVKKGSENLSSLFDELVAEGMLPPFRYPSRRRSSVMSTDADTAVNILRGRE